MSPNLDLKPVHTPCSKGLVPIKEPHDHSSWETFPLLPTGLQQHSNASLAERTGSSLDTTNRLSPSADGSSTSTTM